MACPTKEEQILWRQLDEAVGFSVFHMGLNFDQVIKVMQDKITAIEGFRDRGVNPKDYRKVC